MLTEVLILADSCCVVEGLFIHPIRVPAPLNITGQVLEHCPHSIAYYHIVLYGPPHTLTQSDALRGPGPGR
jgi:hypothetical protein